MNRNIALAWAKALESGDYIQGRLQLRKYGSKGNHKFCCLGVLCNLHAQAHPEIAQQQTDPYKYLGEDLGLPQAVVIWAEMGNNGTRDGGLGGFEFELDKAPYAESLADLNDQNGYTFKQIAEVIRQNFKDL